MFYRLVLLSFIFCSYQWVGQAKRPSSSEESDVSADLGLGLISSLRDDANLDLSVDEEYEDLRAELLAYQTALASVISRSEHRRSLMTTPCWQAGGICINYKLCKGAKYVTEVAGCRDKRNVCCFAWNRYYVKDFRDKGIPNIAMPWVSQFQEYGGKGIQHPKQKKEKKKKLKNKLQTHKKKIIEDSGEGPLQKVHKLLLNH